MWSDIYQSMPHEKGLRRRNSRRLFPRKIKSAQYKLNGYFLLGVSTGFVRYKDLLHLLLDYLSLHHSTGHIVYLHKFGEKDQFARYKLHPKKERKGKNKNNNKNQYKKNNPNQKTNKKKTTVVFLTWSLVLTLYF